MSKITLREYDLTRAGLNTNYSNFSVVVPGAVPNKTAEKGQLLVKKPDGCLYYGNTLVFDENGVYECDNAKDFETYVGLVGPVETETETENDEQEDTDASESPAHYGNEIAYYLLTLGYTVLFKDLTDDEGNLVISNLDDPDFYKPLQDKAAYDFRYIVNGLISDNETANNVISELASFNNTDEDENRGDCTALVDVGLDQYESLTTQQEIVSAIQTAANRLANKDNYVGRYTAIFANPVTYDLDKKFVETNFNGNTTFPAYFHYLVCNAKSLASFAEWYAVSGYTRGICEWPILGTAKKLGEVAITALQPRNSDKGTVRAVNLIVTIKGSFYLWGNRTAYGLGKSNETENNDLRASHFLNIRQLCTTIKKQIYVTCRRYTFDPNTDTLWFNFYSEIVPLLDRMKADQGIRDYKLFKDTRNVQKAKLKAILRIVPIEAVEDFDISMFLEDSIDGNLNIIIDDEQA